MRRHHAGASSAPAPSVSANPIHNFALADNNAKTHQQPDPHIARQSPHNAIFADPPSVHRVTSYASVEPRSTALSARPFVK